MAQRPQDLARTALLGLTAVSLLVSTGGAAVAGSVREFAGPAAALLPDVAIVRTARTVGDATQRQLNKKDNGSKGASKGDDESAESEDSESEDSESADSTESTESTESEDSEDEDSADEDSEDEEDED